MPSGLNNGARFSIRQRQDGSFQAYRDNPYEGIDQPYGSDDEPISGLFADVESAGAELFRHPSFKGMAQAETSPAPDPMDAAGPRP